MRLGWNLNAGVIDVLVKWRGINFHSWKLSSYSCFIQEHWRLAIFIFTSMFVRPPVAKELHRALCLIFRVDQFQWKFFFIFSISSIISFGTTDVKHDSTILDTSWKVLFYLLKLNFSCAKFWEHFKCLILQLRIFFPY